ncbi:MAG: hypothetical protein D6712_21160 [Chloroflexi bacterium]|nr:MAG: hypothetical protein D6712_21160 [Chloroflexota bacterium]
MSEANKVRPEISRDLLTVDTRRRWIQIRSELAGYTVPLLVLVSVFVVVSPFVSAGLILVPELALLLGLWLFRTGTSKVKVPDGFRMPPDFPAKRPWLYPRRRWRIETARGRGDICVGYDLDNGVQLWLKGKDLCQHQLGAGTTGAGKTVTLLGQAFGFLNNGSGVMIMDAKGSNELYLQFLSLMHRFGMTENLRVINFLVASSKESPYTAADLMRLSNSLELFRRGNAEALRNMLMGLLRDVKEPIWKAKAGALLYAMLVIMLEKRDKFGLEVTVSKVRDYLKPDIFGMFYFDASLTPRTQTLLRQYLDEQPGFTFEVAQSIAASFFKSLREEIAKRKQTKVGFDDLMEDIEKRWFVSLSDAGREVVQTLFDEQKAITAPPTEDEFRRQWGYLSFQLTEALQMMQMEYQHIFNAPGLAEIDLETDILDRRTIVILMPTLERDKDTFAMLAKIMVAGLRRVFSVGVGSQVQGERSNILDAKPTNAPYPYKIDLDEYPQYAADATGLGSAAALVRSMGFALCFAGQQLASLERANMDEFSQVIANTTAMKWTGLLEDKRTIEIFAERANKALHASIRNFDIKDNDPTKVRLGNNVSVNEENRLRPRQIANLRAGEGYIIRRDTLVHAQFFGLLIGEAPGHFNLLDKYRINYVIQVTPLNKTTVELIEHKLLVLARLARIARGDIPEVDIPLSHSGEILARASRNTPEDTDDAGLVVMLKALDLEAVKRRLDNKQASKQQAEEAHSLESDDSEVDVREAKRRILDDRRVQEIEQKVPQQAAAVREALAKALSGIAEATKAYAEQHEMTKDSREILQEFAQSLATYPSERLAKSVANDWLARVRQFIERCERELMVTEEADNGRS